MSLRSNGSYIGPRPTGPTNGALGVASGIWDLRTAQRQRSAGAWPFPFSSPTQITGLQLWLDASDADTLFDATSGGSLVAADGTVKRWEDKSGNNRHATEAINGPQRKTAVQGGKDVLRFDGSNDSLASSDFLDLSAGQAITASAVMKRGATGSTHTILCKFDATNIGSEEDGWFFRFTNTDALNAGFAKDGEYTQRSSSSSVSASTFSVLAFKATAGSLTTSTVLYQDGVALSSSNSGSGQTLDNTSYSMVIGRLPYQGVNYDFLNGDIAEIIIYDTALSDTEREAVENYLLAKWAIT